MVDECTLLRIQTMQAVMQVVARLYRNVLDEETAAQLAAMDMESEGDPIFENDACRRGFALMRECCQTKSELPQISADYHNLFVGPHKLLAAPWSSVYLDASGLVFGQTALEVRRLFSEQGLAIPEGPAEPSDHVAYEWQFMAGMHGRAAGAYEAGNSEGVIEAVEAARRFFEGYLDPWMQPFCAAVAEGAKTDFYRGLSEFTTGVAELERQLLDDVSEP